jgi:hypothetical protein
MRSLRQAGTTAAILLSMAILAATAQAQPARNGNVWDGKSHEPAAGAVESQQRSAGVAPAPEKEKALNNEVDNTADKLLEHRPGPSVVGSPVTPQSVRP